MLVSAYGVQHAAWLLLSDDVNINNMALSNEDRVVLNEMLFGGPSLAGVLGSVVRHSDSLKHLVCVPASAMTKRKLVVKPSRYN